MSLTLSFIIWFLIGAACGYFALSRGRDPYIWFAIGIFFGVFGMIALFLLPPVKAEENQELPTPEKTEPVSVAEPLPITVSVEEGYQSKLWFYIIPSLPQVGPITFEDLKKMWKDEIINSTTFVWSAGMESWVRIEGLPLLKNALMS